MIAFFFRQAYTLTTDAMNVDGKFSLFCEATKIHAATFVLHHCYDSSRKRFVRPCDLGSEVQDLIKRYILM